MSPGASRDKEMRNRGRGISHKRVGMRVIPLHLGQVEVYRGILLWYYGGALHKLNVKSNVVICLGGMMEVFCGFKWYSGLACDPLLSYRGPRIHRSVPQFSHHSRMIK